MFKDITSPVPPEERDCVISPSPCEVSPQIDSRNLPKSFNPPWQSCGKPVFCCRQCECRQCECFSALWWQCGEAPAKDWGWSLSLLCRKGLFLFVLEPCPLSWHYTSFFFSLSHHSVTCHHMEKKKVKGNFTQSNNQRISELCSVIIQRICFAVTALIYTGSRDVSYQFPFGFCAC